jgi:ParB-like chromosome segregation protein Spo0J
MKQQPELTVEEVPTESLIPYARNAKIHTNEQIDQICESIGEFGFNDPVAVWDGPDGPEIIEGHGRVMAAKKLGLDVVPVVRLDHLSDEQRRAYGIVHNKLTMNTGWDFAKLDEELGELQAMDMAAYGFDDMQIDWDDGVDELTEESYDEPGKKKLCCPSCGHVDSAERFKQV